LASPADRQRTSIALRSFTDRYSAWAQHKDPLSQICRQERRVEPKRDEGLLGGRINFVPANRFGAHEQLRSQHRISAHGRREYALKRRPRMVFEQRAMTFLDQAPAQRHGCIGGDGLSVEGKLVLPFFTAATVLHGVSNALRVQIGVKVMLAQPGAQLISGVNLNGQAEMEILIWLMEGR